MKRVSIFLVALLTSLFSFAAKISVEDAKLVSKNFILEKYASEGIKVATTDFSLQYTSLDDEGVPVFYRFQVGEKGFIIVSAMDLVTPVLAYSLEENFKDNSSSDYLLGKYTTQIQDIRKSKKSVSSEVEAKWERYLAADFTPAKSKGTAVTGPFITATWDQGKYYNIYCPFDAESPTGYDDHVPNGCVALAMSMIMYYYRYPVVGKLSLTYTPGRYDLQSVNFSDHTYNYDLMTDKPTSYSNEMAKLIYHAGVSVRMGYAPEGSGAQSEEALAAMKKYWGYNQAARRKSKGSLSSSAWGDSLKAQLDKHYPLYYSAQNNSGGHAFVIDGYDDENFFHVNWGWGGFGNGYFLINDLTPPTDGGTYSYYEAAMFDLYPAENIESCAGHVRNTASFGTISNISGYKNYANNSTCSWMVAAPGASSYTFKFSKIDTEQGQDVVVIYNGPTESSGIAGTYSGTTLPSSLTVQADSVLIKFTSNSSITGKGFLMNYTSQQGSPLCTGTQLITNLREGSIRDHTDEGNYRSNSQCRWYIRPSGFSQYKFSFSRFDLKSGDLVDVIDYTNINNPVLFKRFDKDNLPNGIYTLDATKFVVNFVSDNWEEGEGFQLDWLVSTGIEEVSPLRNVSVYPNPASDFIVVELTTEAPEQIQFKIVDIAGKLLYNEAVDHQGGEVRRNLPVHDFAKGFYFMQLETSKGKTIQKFIVN